MAAPAGRVSWDVVREAVRRELDVLSIRELARQIGLNSSTLFNFLDGATPRSQVSRALTEWYATIATRDGGLDPGVAEAVVSLQLDGLGGKVRQETLQSIVATLAEAHRRQGTQAPEWLRRLQDTLSADAAQPG